MAVINGYIGAAGTGKTTELINKVKELIDNGEIVASDFILAISYMHGSRRRLSSKLNFLKKHGIGLRCETIDSFSYSIVKRNRRKLGINKTINICAKSFLTENTYETEKEIYTHWDHIRELALTLLKDDSIVHFISVTYPVIIIDEFQDCHGDLFELVKSLTKTDSILLLAGDEFQFLDRGNDECESIHWLKSACKVKELDIIHRTKVNKILNTSNTLRNNVLITPTIEIATCASPYLAAWTISSKIHWKYWSKSNTDLVILSPVNRQKSIFLNTTLSRLEKHFPKYHFPAYPFSEEKSEDIDIKQVLKLLPNWNSIDSISKNYILDICNNENPIIRGSSKRTLNYMKLNGVDILDKTFFLRVIDSQIYSSKVYGYQLHQNRLFLTIHSAKNREFDYVIIIWPYAVKNNPESKRRLLYNAVTRAKRDALVIYQHENNTDRFNILDIVN